ncbi:sigma-54 dependent transcriptional regulator [Bdellovibrionota bacterium FG-2]
MSSMHREILGESAAVKELLHMISRVSGNKANILVIGESGTGKELIARMIHDSGPLKDKPFVPINCGAIPENLIESELFGHKKGSFTGAIAEKAGLFETANGGTLFLDEIGELPLAMQVKLLRALQEKTIRKVGGTDDQKVDARIIAATNRNLESGVAKGTFREDLYYRLNVITIKSPPLRERAGDIPLLARTFLQRVAQKYNKTIEGIDDLTLTLLCNYAWPGNIRELQNIIERAATLETGSKLSINSLPAHLIPAVMPPVLPPTSSQPASVSPDTTLATDIRIPAPNFSAGPVKLDEILGKIEKQYLHNALLHTHGVKKKAAQILGITFRSIRYRLQKLGLDVPEVSDKPKKKKKQN